MRYPHLRLVLASVFLLVPLGQSVAQRPAQPLDTLRISVASRLHPSFEHTGRAVQVIDATEIRRLPVRNVAEVLAWMQGIDVRARSGAQADVSMRGATAEQALVLVDGVRVSDRQTAHFALDLTVPLDQIERIEVLRGPASAVYGADAVGGVINIVTRSGGEPRASVRLASGSFGAAMATGSVARDLGPVQADVGLEYRRADGWRPGTDYAVTQGRARFSALVQDQPLTLALGWAARDFGARAFYTPPAAPFDEYEETRTASAQLGYRAALGERITLEPRVNVRRHDDMFLLRRDDPAFYQNDHRSWQNGAELVARATFARTSVALGGEAYLDQLTSSALGDRDESRSALFSEVALGGSRSRATLGVRFDSHSRYGEFVAPSAAVHVQLHRLLSMRASTGRAFRAPSWTERYYVDPANTGNPDLVPERGLESELGIELGTPGGPRVGLSGFLRKTDNLIDWVKPAGAPAGTPWRAENVSSATFRGIELNASATDGLGTRWSLTATGLRFSSKAPAGMESKYALRPITQSYQLAAERAVAGPVTIALRATREQRAGKRVENTGDARVSATYRSARVFLDVLNLGDSRVPDVSGLPRAGRAVHAGVAWGW